LLSLDTAHRYVIGADLENLHIMSLENRTRLIGLRKKGVTTFISELHSPVTPEPENLSRASIRTSLKRFDRNTRTRNTAILSSSSPRVRHSRNRTRELVERTLLRQRIC